MDARTTRLADLARLACRAATSDLTYDIDSFFDALTHVSVDELPTVFRLARALEPDAAFELAALHRRVLKVADEDRPAAKVEDHCTTFMMALEGNETAVDRLRLLDPCDLERAACEALSCECSRVEEIVALVERLLGRGELAA